MISKNKLFLISGFCFLLWTFFNNYLESIFLSGIILVLWGILFFNFFAYTQKYALFLAFWWLSCILGVTLSFFSLNSIAHTLWGLEPYYNTKHLLQWEIKDIYKIKEFESVYILKLSYIDFKKTKKLSGLISIPSNFTVKKWDFLDVRDYLRPIENFSADFNYKKFLYSKKIFFTIRSQSIHKTWEKDLGIIVDNVDRFRWQILSTIQRLYPWEEGLFLWGILVWARESLSQELKQDFNASGLTHFIAVSGFNITILVVFISFLVKIFPLFIRVIIITMCILLFTLLVWDAAPVIRASIMGIIAYYIMISGRTAHNLSLLLFTAIIMVMLSPLSLNYDVSFHLSFLAVIGILYTQDFFKRIFYFLPETLAIKEAFVLTLSALSFALPIMIFNFWQLPTLSIFANLAVTWTIPLAMLFWFLSLWVFIIFPVAWVWLAYFTWVLLAWDIQIVHFFGGLDWSIIHADFWIYKYIAQIFYFIILIFVISFFRKKD